jgi:hypothetical protein
MTSAKCSKTTSPTTPPKFEIGDRVAERPKSNYIPGLRPEIKQKIAPYSEQRYGVVVENFVKVNTSLRRAVETKYVRVLWDGHQNPMEHAQSRLVLADELPQVLESYMESLGG